MCFRLLHYLADQSQYVFLKISQPSIGNPSCNKGIEVICCCYIGVWTKIYLERLLRRQPRNRARQTHPQAPDHTRRK